MMISGWNSRYSEIIKEFNYKKREDLASAKLLDSLLKNKNHIKKIQRLIKNQNVFVIGAGPSLSKAIPILREYNKTVKIVADSAVKHLIDNGISPDIIVTDLDGDEKTFRKIGRTKTIFVVHAHGDNISKLDLIENFKNCIGTTQTKPFGKLQNFGGFTDGDRSVFLASYFEAKKIVLFGMDFGKKIGTFSNTKVSERSIKLKKLRKGRFLLEWLAKKTKSELFTTSSAILGFKKIPYQKLDIIIT
ncbi:MAG: 6-hydroxymethylpterin diphosphokinase MptE-like protein [Nitrosopumilaceae archaeon]